MASTRSKSAQGTVRQRRERMRALGLRPIQIWVPDTASPRFRAEAHRQSALVAAGENDADDQAFIDSISERDDA